MIQRFIELGEGYSDIYELVELAKANKDRLHHMMAFHTVIKGRAVSSLAIVMEPTEKGKFQAIYVCREGIPNPNITSNQRFSLFQEAAKELNKEIIQLDVKPSTQFPENDLYYHHLIAILRLNHFLLPLQ